MPISSQVTSIELPEYNSGGGYGLLAEQWMDAGPLEMIKFGLSILTAILFFYLAYPLVKSLPVRSRSLRERFKRIWLRYLRQTSLSGYIINGLCTLLKLAIVLIMLLTGFLMMGYAADILLKHVIAGSKENALNQAKSAVQSEPIERKLGGSSISSLAEGEKADGKNVIEASNLVEAYAGILLGVLALGGLVLQFWQIRDQQREFRHTLETNLLEQEMDRLRRSFDTILPDGMKKGYRSRAQDYEDLLGAYSNKCQRESEQVDTDFLQSAQDLIQKMRPYEARLKELRSTLVTDL